MHHNAMKCIISKVVDLKSSIGNVNLPSKFNERSSSLSGGIFSDFDLAWSFSGAILKVFNTTDGIIQSSWDFSSITRDIRTQIRCVIEYPVSDGSRLLTKENQICLVVSYTSKRDASKSSYISFCHPRTSRILHTITTKEKVTCLSLISTRKDHASPLGGVIKCMSGTLAIGTHSGNLLLLDIKDIFSCCRRNAFDPIQNRFSEMMILDLKRLSENEIKDKISKLDDEFNHIAVSLSDKKDSRDPDVEICALTYIPQSTCLAVGLKNGSFQLWDVNTLKKLYKSPAFEVPTPIVGFGFQEPCNDPQNFCYLWVIFESDLKKESCIPFAVMYGILYKKSTIIPGYGRHYKNFVHCKKRFDLDVDLDRCISGRCISNSVVSNTSSHILRHTSSNDNDTSKINLFILILETWERSSDVNSTISMAVFDMNQWYKAQMPHQCYLGYAVPFVNFMLLERVSERKSSILDVRIKKDTIQQFLTFNLSEEYSYPSSLSFDTIFLTDVKIINVRVPGAQRSVLERIFADGPISLVNPSKYYTECKEAGLRPCFADAFSRAIVPSQIQQRNYVLTLLLENKISSFFVRCVKDWADGSRGVTGCTLPNLIEWAWDCLGRIKQTTDVICIPLFDYSGDDLDRENYQKLKHCVQLMRIIRDLLVYIHKNYKYFLLDDIKLKHQVDTLLLVTSYFDAIIWCLDCGLLPEKISGLTDKCVPIYIVNILQYTEQRREELKRIALKNTYFLIDDAAPLIVDAMLEKEPKKSRLQMQWQRESGGMTSGLYPPVTLQSLLRMFLLPDLSNDVKHFIMLYFLFDVCDYHRDDDMKEQLLSFSVIFSVDIAFFALVQSCWLLDHEKFDEAIDTLTTDAVLTQLRKQPQLYKSIMHACICQKQYGVALKLERQVKLSGTVFPDERFYITLLLQNGLVVEAYTTLKKVSFRQKELLRHFFKVCDDFGLLKEIFKFPISVSEENEFMSYLNECRNKDAGDLKIMYLLSRGRYVEAIDVNHNLASVVPKFEVVGRETTKQNANSGRTTTRDLLVGAFSKTLPGVTNELITFCRKEKDKIYRYKEVTKPTPLSVVVHTDTSQQIPTYKSSFESILHAAISKTAETWTNFPTLGKRKKLNTSVVKDTPFLRSDIMTPRKDVNSRFNRTKSISIEEAKKPDVNEPPMKRKKTSMNVTFDIVAETNENELLSSPSAGVTNILTTPHVQKRLKKLLLNTPESSSLHSILKSSEISRFKQPQKVGFNMPESNRPSSQKVAVIAETPVRSPRSALKDSASVCGAKKVIADQFVSSQTRADVIVENVAVTQQNKKSPPTRESLDTSLNADSYYSLESDNEMNDFVGDQSASKQSAATQTSVSHQRTFIEAMSEDEMAAEPYKRLIMEVMSEEESAAEGQTRLVVSDVLAARPTSPTSANQFLVSHVASSAQRTVSSPLSQEPPPPQTSPLAIERSSTQTPTFIAELAVDPVARTVPEFSFTDVAHQPATPEACDPVEVSSEKKDDEFSSHSFQFSAGPNDRESNEAKTSPRRFQFQIMSTCTVAREEKSVEELLESDENASLATMQPVIAEPAPGTDIEGPESKIDEQQRSWQSIYEEYRTVGHSPSQLNDVDEDNENVSGDERNVSYASSSPVSYSAGESDAESVHDEEVAAADSSSRSQPPTDSVTEIRDSSCDEDSDIEILEDECVLAPPRAVGDSRVDEDSDNASERTYESEYSYSDEGSVGGDSYVEDNSLVEAEEGNDELAGEDRHENEEEYEEEDEYEEGAGEADETDEDDDKSVEDEQEFEERGTSEGEAAAVVGRGLEEMETAHEGNDVVELESCALPARGEAPIVQRQIELLPTSDETAVVSEQDYEIQSQKQPGSEENATAVASPVIGFDPEALYRENPSINFEELKNIVSNVTKIEVVASPRLEAVKKYEASVASPSFNRSDNDFSICEVYDTTASVIEETVNLDYSDAAVSANKTNVNDSTADTNVSAMSAIENVNVTVDDSHKANASVEVLSLSSVAKNESSTELPMVFYFGENSVTSIAEDMLVDETTDISKSASVFEQSGQKVGESTYSSVLSAADSSEVAQESNAVEDAAQVADNSSERMEIEGDDAAHESVQHESIFIVDLENETSLEEEMAKNRPMFSSVKKNDQSSNYDRDTPYLINQTAKRMNIFASAPVPQNTAVAHSVKKSSEPILGFSTKTTSTPSSFSEAEILEVPSSVRISTSPTHIVTEPAGLSSLVQSSNASIMVEPTIAQLPSPAKQFANDAGHQSSPRGDTAPEIQALSPTSDAIQKTDVAYSSPRPKPIDTEKQTATISYTSNASPSLAPENVSCKPGQAVHVSVPSSRCSSSPVLTPMSSPKLLESVEVQERSSPTGMRTSAAIFTTLPNDQTTNEAGQSVSNRTFNSRQPDDSASTFVSPFKSANETYQSTGEVPESHSSAVLKLHVPEDNIEKTKEITFAEDKSSLSRTVYQPSSDEQMAVADSSNMPTSLPDEQILEKIDQIHPVEDSNERDIVADTVSSKTSLSSAEPFASQQSTPTKQSGHSPRFSNSPVTGVHYQSSSPQKVQRTPEMVYISSSVSPCTSSEKTSAPISPSLSSQSVSRTVTAVSTPQTVSPAILPLSQTPLQPVSILVRSPMSHTSSLASSPQTSLGFSSPEPFDGTYDSHIGLRHLKKDSAASSRTVSPATDAKIADTTLVAPDAINESRSSDVEFVEQVPYQAAIAPSPRRSVRLARRQSTDSIILEAVPEDVSEASQSPVKRASRTSLRRSVDRSVAAEAAPLQENAAADTDDNDDAASVKSAASAAESVSSRASSAASNGSRSRKRSSFTRLEMRKSSLRPSYRPLQVIMSDEEMTSPTKSEIGPEPRKSVVVERKYAASEPGDLSAGGSRRSKRSRVGSETSDDDSERFSKVTRRRVVKSRAEKSDDVLNAAMMASPTPKKSKTRKLISSTPMKSGGQELKAGAASTAAVNDYTMSRRLTRFQKTLLVDGIRRGERGVNVGETRLPGSLKMVQEETESTDSEKYVPEDSMLPEEEEIVAEEEEEVEEEEEEEDELTTWAVRNRTIKTRASDVRASRRISAPKSASKSSSASAAAAPSDGASSDESVSSRTSVASRASTASTKRKARPSTFTKMELRRSSARPHFKPLAVIASDEESPAFQTPPRRAAARSGADEETLPSSSESTHSRRSVTGRRRRRSTSASTTATTRSGGRDDRSEDRDDTSSVSEAGQTTATGRRTRRSVASEPTEAATVSATHQPEILAKMTPVKKRPTKAQATVAEPPIKEIPKKRKRT